jgi:hypothetical protein
MAVEVHSQPRRVSRAPSAAVGLAGSILCDGAERAYPEPACKSNWLVRGVGAAKNADPADAVVLGLFSVYRRADVNDPPATSTNSTENAADIAPVDAPAASALRIRRRFSWPMRCVLGYFLFDMVVRSVITLTPYDKAWRGELEMARFPTRLPTTAQREKIVDGRDEKFTSVAQRYWASARSCFWFASPLPRDKTLPHLNSATDYGKYVVVWLGTRLGFVGALLGLDEDWPMFSPNVRRAHVAPRAKLIYADGTREQLWLLGEPYDPTRFHRWLIKRPLQIDLRLAKDYDARVGVSRNIAERYATSATGSPLETIEMYEVKYSLPGPRQNAYKVLAKQAQKPTGDKPFWRYDVASDKGQTFDEKKDKKKKDAKAADAAKSAAAESGLPPASSRGNEGAEEVGEGTEQELAGTGGAAAVEAEPGDAVEGNEGNEGNEGEAPPADNEPPPAEDGESP